MEINNLYDVLVRLGAKQIQDKGSYFHSTCPVHLGSDNPTAFSFIKPTGPWTCFTRSCHEKARRDIYGLIKACTGKMPKIAEDYYQEQEAQSFINSVIPQSRREKIESKVDTVIPSAFLNRGISREVLEEIGAGMVVSGYGAGRSALPLKHPVTGETLGWTMRARGNDLPKWKHTPGCPKSTVLFGAPKALEYARRHGLLILTEGPLDVLKCWTAGIKNVVALMGVILSSEQLKLILMNINNVIVAMDGDKAGYEANKKITETLNSFSIRAFQCNLSPNQDLGDMSTNQIIHLLKPYFDLTKAVVIH